MNYIAQLRAELAERERQLKAYREAFASFRAQLHGPKFSGTEGGERKDWIATADVLLWLRETESAVL